MADTVLKPAQNKALALALDRCARCQPFIDRLEAAGYPVKDLQDRVEHLKAAANALIDVDTQLSRGGE